MEEQGPFANLSPTSGISGYRAFMVIRPSTTPDSNTSKSPNRSRLRIDSLPVTELGTNHAEQYFSNDLPHTRQCSATGTLNTVNALTTLNATIHPSSTEPPLPPLLELSDPSDSDSPLAPSVREGSTSSLHTIPLHDLTSSERNLIAAAKYESVPSSIPQRRSWSWCSKRKRKGSLRGGLYSIIPPSPSPNDNDNSGDAEEEKSHPARVKHLLSDLSPRPRRWPTLSRVGGESNREMAVTTLYAIAHSTTSVRGGEV